MARGKIKALLLLYRCRFSALLDYHFTAYTKLLNTQYQRFTQQSTECVKFLRTFCKRCLECLEWRTTNLFLRNAIKNITNSIIVLGKFPDLIGTRKLFYIIHMNNDKPYNSSKPISLCRHFLKL